MEMEMEQATTLRWCSDIGMFAYDRPIPQSCVHATQFCRETCYNQKLYRMYSRMHTKDVSSEAYWASIDGAKVKKDLRRRRHQTDRLRLMTRGEAFRDYTDIERVASIAAENPHLLVWVPTRAWRDPLLNAMVTQLRLRHSNLRILASTDPTTTAEEWEELKANGWSTMFYGDNTQRVTPNGDRYFACPKTHGAKVKGACAVCKRGCFRADKRVDVHLHQH